MGRKTGPQQPKGLTEKQKQVLELLESGRHTQATVSRQLKISRAAVSKHVSTLKKKGFFGLVNRIRLTTGVLPGVGGVNNLIRLHGEQYKIELVEASEKYDKARLRASSVLVWGNRVVFYRDLLMVHSYESFYGPTVEDCDAQAGEYWVRFFRRLETLYDVLILKERKENILRVKCHYGETGNELADELRKKKQKLRVFGSRDGKEWLLFDDSAPESIGLSEAETTHSPTPKDSRSAGEDMQKVVRPFFNDLRENAERVLLPSQSSAMLSEVLFFTRENAAGLNMVVSLVKRDFEAREAERKEREAVFEPSKQRPDYLG